MRSLASLSTAIAASPAPAEIRTAHATDTNTPLTVALLCAAWCRTCEAFRPAFDARAARAAGQAHRWIDVEDEADALGDLDIETFPTLLLARGGEVLFFGPILPRTEAIDALVAARSAPDAVPALAAADLAGLLAHLAV
jgi:hypothetical protein